MAVPVSNCFLRPCDTRAINNQKEHQQYYYDRHAKPLKSLKAEETIRVRLRGQKTWSPTVHSGPVGPRSYEVTTEEQVLTRNRRRLIRSDEPPELDIPDVEVDPDTEHKTVQADSNGTMTPAASPAPDKTPGPRQSQRNRKPPDWLTKYAKT